MGSGAINYEDRRNHKQRLVDRLLLLYLFDRVSDKSRITGDVKLQKLTFLSENEMIKDKKNGLNYKFFKWQHGPMSKGVYEDHAYLCENELVSESSGKILKKGEEVIRHGVPILEENSHIIKEIEKIVDNYGEMSGFQLKGIVYDKEIERSTGDRSTVESLSKGVDIFDPISMGEFQDQFNISDEWAETLSIMFDTDAKSSVEESLREAKEKSSSKFNSARSHPKNV